MAKRIKEITKIFVIIIVVVTFFETVSTSSNSQQHSAVSTSEELDYSLTTLGGVFSKICNKKSQINYWIYKVYT